MRGRLPVFCIDAAGQLLAERIRATGPISFRRVHARVPVSSAVWLLQQGGSAALRGFLHQRGRAPDFWAPAGAATLGNVGAAGPTWRVLCRGGRGGRGAPGARKSSTSPRESCRNSMAHCAISPSSKSAARRERQRETLAQHLADGRATSAAELPSDISAGCIFSNELLDAFPVHRVVFERRRLCVKFMWLSMARA